MLYYRIRGKEYYTGNLMVSGWYPATNPIAHVELQMQWARNFAYDLQVEYSEEVSE